jgi:hypothetical protein
MNEADIRSLLGAIQVDHSKHGYSGNAKTTRWLQIRCPFAPWRHAGASDSHPSFGITIKEGSRSSYKCFSCQSKGRLASLPTILGTLRKRDYSKQRRWAEVNELQSGLFKPLPNWESDNAEIEEPSRRRSRGDPTSAEQSGYPNALGIRYLSGRGIDVLTSIKLGLRYDHRQRRVLFPCYDEYEHFVGFTGRSTKKGNDETKGNDPKVKDYYGLPKRRIFLRLRPSQRKGHKKIITEGLFDYARLVKLGYYGSSAILGTGITEEKRDILIKEGDPAYFFLDNDVAGWQALFGIFDDNGKLETKNSWAYQLYREIPVWIVPYPTVFNGADPGTLQAATVHKAISKSWLFTGKAPVRGRNEPVWRLIKNP